MNTSTHLVLAPIRGITDCHFRSLFQHYFPGFDSALAPFINPQRAAVFHAGQLKDVLPETNRKLPVIPQLLHNTPSDFLFLAQRLYDLGHREINWNLGCPAPMVTRKHKGSGLLAFPEEIVAFLDEVIPKLPLKLSIKTRLGFENRGELYDLLPKLDAYPLSEIIIHGRLGKQMYRGIVDREGFAECLGRTRHTVVYNGDITTLAEFKELQQSFPGINKWMIGRGALANPFLAGAIKGMTNSNEQQTLREFHDELYACYAKLLDGPAHLLGRMKQLWTYLSASFPPRHKSWKLIKKCRTEEHYKRVVEGLLSSDN